ncbi:hypothetical protein XENORESO_022076 [Xenotaenia resolanae]|uniref:Uncharacterized protein n=1 Tax=Xenotaenia resolanae TaxID=208358 RepID=A0ABV0XAN4_9TELE
MSSPSTPSPPVPEATPPPAGHGYIMRPRTQPKPSYMGPLFQQQFGGNRYKPFTLGDLTTLCEKLPPITEGASIWLQTLDSLTAGTTLALGDYRAIAVRCMKPHSL